MLRLRQDHGKAAALRRPSDGAGFRLEADEQRLGQFQLLDCGRRNRFLVFAIFERMKKEIKNQNRRSSMQKSKIQIKNQK
jgi:hypothetical protein